MFINVCAEQVLSVHTSPFSEQPYIPCTDLLQLVLQ